MNTASPADRWQEGNPYEQYIGRWSRKVAPAFLAWLGMPPGKRWLDVGCGTGALLRAIVENAAPSEATGVEPSDGFRALAASSIGHRAALHPGNASALPLADGSVDVVVSGLVLNFVPDLPSAMREMRRVTAHEGTIAAYVWDYADGMALIRHFWDAAVALDPAAGALHEGARFALCRASALHEAFEAAGLRAVAVTALDAPTCFANFDDYWNPFLGGQGPAPTYVASLAEEHRQRLRDGLRARLPTGADGSIELTARAWAVRGGVPG